MGWLHNEEEWLSLHLIFTLLTTRMHLRGHTWVFFTTPPPPRHNIHLPLLPICGRVSGWVPTLHAKPHSEAVKMKWISSLAARGGCVLRDTPWQERAHNSGGTHVHKYNILLAACTVGQSQPTCSHSFPRITAAVFKLGSSSLRLWEESIWMSPPFGGFTPSTSEEVSESSSFWRVLVISLEMLEVMEVHFSVHGAELFFVISCLRKMLIFPTTFAFPELH